MSKLAGEVSKILAEKDQARKKALVEQFKADNAAHLGSLIDPDHPDLGPKNNLLLFEGGRMEPGRQAVVDRTLKDAYGTVNLYHAGGGLCSASVYQARSEMTNEFVDGKWTGGKKESAPDALNSEFILAFGINFFEGRATTPYASRITEGLASGRLKLAVVDPRMSKMAGKAWKWLPVKPGTDGALAMGMIRWILENKAYDARFLGNANRAAANADGEPSFSNATWLVKIDGKGKPGAFVRGSELGIAATEVRKTADGKDWTFDPFVTLSNGSPAPLDPSDTKNAVEGSLLVDTAINGIRLKSAFQLLTEEAFSRSVEEWGQIAGIARRSIETVAREFTSHGKKAATAEYKGVATHSNAFSATQAIWTLNTLIGNIGWTGGLGTGGGSWDDAGGKAGQPYALSKLLPGKLGGFGIPITRQGAKYDEGTLFAGYPAKRPWIPIPGGAIRQELYPSVGDGYPYKAGALFMYKANTAMQSPGGQLIVDTLKDTEKIPLFVACDVVVADTSMFADYIFPDLTVWESWGFPGGIPEVPQKLSKVRQPAAAPIPENATVFGEEMPISLEAICLAIAEKLQLPGFGANGFGQGVDLKRPEDYYLKRVANIAFGEKADGSDAVSDASEVELYNFTRARRHLPPSVFELAKWQAAVKPELWRKVVYVLNRGGKFESFERGYKGEQLAYVPKGVMALYLENVAKARNSMTGELFSGVPHWEAPHDLLGKEIKVEDGEFALISYKDVHQGHSRTMSAYWALGPFSSNVLYMNKSDAKSLRLKEGGSVRLSSRTNNGSMNIGGAKLQMVTKVEPIEGIRPGVVALSQHFGHWAYGARDIVIDGEVIKGDPRRGKGLAPNLLVPLDPSVPNAVTSELVSGNGANYDAIVKLKGV